MCQSRFTGMGSTDVRPATRILHETLIRLAKGVVHAWEEWLKRTLEYERNLKK